MLHHLTFADLAREHRRGHPLDTAVVDGPVRRTYPELDDRTSQLADALTSAGVGCGDRVLSITTNGAPMLETLIACAKVGAVYCPGNWRQSADELTFVLEDLAPKVVLWQEDEVGAATKAAREAAAVDATWLQVDGLGEGSYEAFLGTGSPIDPELPVDPASPLLAMYTAAFAGRPSAVLLSHTALIAHDAALAIAARLEPGFTYLGSGPLFHVGTMMFTTATFHLGGTNVFQARFDAEEACRLVEAEGCNSMFLVPPMIDEMVAANDGGRFDLTSLRLPAGPDAWNAMVTLDESPWARAFAGYGQSEVGGMLTYAGFGVGGIGAFGRPSPLVQVRILDPDGHEVATGEAGEICARGLHVATGYHARPDVQASRQAHGWHHTGDLGRREADGTLSFIGPRGRLVKSAAENIYPAEVERALATHPGVASCAVIGVPDERWGQSVKAIVVRAEGSLVTEEDLIEHCREALASYKKPRVVVFVDDIPRQGYSPDYDALDAAHGGGGYPGT